MSFITDGSGRSVAVYIFDSDRISAAAASYSETKTMSGSTLTSTRSHRQRRAVGRGRRRERRDVQRHGDDPPDRARPRISPVASSGVELNDLAARRHDLALAFGENLLVAIVTDDAQGDHRRLGALGTPKVPERDGWDQRPAETRAVAKSV